MAIDRGGLQYRIVIEDAFSTNLDKFTKGIQDAKRELDSLKATGGQFAEITKAIKGLNEETKKLAAANKKAAKDDFDSSKVRSAALKAEIRERRKLSVAQARARIQVKEGLNDARRLATAEQQQAVAAKKITRVLDDRQRKQRLLNEVRERGIKLTDEERRKLSLMGSVEQQIFDLQKKRARLIEQTSNSRIKALTAETLALERKRKADVEAGAAAILAAQGRDASGKIRGPAEGKKQEAQTTRRAKALERLRGVLGRVDKQANRVSFTFRRLFGILAAFAAARAVLRFFRSLVSETIRFNAAIEQAALGVSALFLAVGDVRDAMGQATTSAHGLALAQAEARKQIGFLRRDALKTAATFEQLLTTFQVAVAPGFQAGLDIDEIRKFTIDISRAASAIGLQQNQLAEEIRSILAGTIQARTTRIAVSLGITNEDIRNAKEAGVLVEFLQEKFGAFESAGEEALKTFNALFTNLQGAIQQVLESGGTEFFIAIKDILKELFELLIDQDDITKAITPSPGAVQVVRAFTDALAEGLKIAKQVGESLKVDELAAAASAAGNAIVIIATVLSGIVKGAIQGVKDLGKGAKAVVSIIGKLTGVTVFDHEALSETIALISRIFTIFLGITAALAVVKIIIGAIALGATVITGIITVWNGLMFVFNGLLAVANFLAAPLTIPFAIVAGILVALIASLVVGVVLLKQWFDEITGVELKFISFIKLLGTNITFIFKDMVNSIAKFIDVVILEFNSFLDKTITKTITGATRLFSKLLGLLAKVSDTAKDLKAQIDEFADKKDAALEKRLAADAADILRTAQAYDAASQQLQDDLAKRSQEIIDADAEQASIAELAGNVLKPIGAAISGALVGILGNLLPDFESLISEFKIPEAVKEAKLLSDAFDEMGGIIAQNRKGLSAQSELLKKLEEDALKVKDALTIETATLGLSGVADTVRTTILEGENRLAKEREFLEKETSQVLTTRIGILAKLSKNQDRILQLNAKQTLFLEKGTAAFQELTKLNNERAKVENTRLIQEIKRRVALEEGFQDESEAAGAREEAAEATLEVLDKQIKALRDGIDLSAANLGLSVEEARIARKSLEAKILLTGELSIAEERLLDIARDRITLARELAIITAQQVSIDVRAATIAQLLANQRSLIQLQSERAALLERTILNNAAKRSIVTKDAFDALAVEVDILQNLRTKNLSDLSDSIGEKLQELNAIKNQLQGLDPDDPAVSDDRKRLAEDIVILERTRNDLLETRSALIDDNIVKSEIEHEQLKLLALEAVEARRGLEEPIAFGFIKGVEDFINQALDLFSKFQEIVSSSFQKLSGLISNAIVGALTGKGTNFREQFGQFLAGIAQQIINMLIQVAIAKALLRLGFLGGDQVPSFGTLLSKALGGSLAKGGAVDRLTAYSPHASAPGYAHGGRLPVLGGSAGGGNVSGVVNRASRTIVALKPKSVDPRDKVPIWASPGEWVVRAKSVRLYGSDIMDAINQGTIDPTALRAIAGVAARGKAARRVSGSAVAGGAITTTSGAPVAEAGPQSGQGPVTAIVAGTEENMQQMLVGGGNALLDFLRENRDEFMGEERAV